MVVVSKKGLTVVALVLVLLVSSLLFGPDWSWGSVSGEGLSECDCGSMAVVEDVSVFENGDALLAIVNTVPNSWLADKYRTNLAAPHDADAGEELPIPENRIQPAEESLNLVENAFPVQEEFFRSVQQEQEYSFGFTTNVRSSKMMPKGPDGEFTFSVDATARLQVINVKVDGSQSVWNVAVGPKDESAKKIAIGYIMTKITFAKMMLESIEGQQAYQVYWSTRIKLPDGAVLLNSIELEGASWTLDLGGGTYMSANVSVEGSTVFLNERTFVTEENVTATPKEIFDSFCRYRNIMIVYSLPSSSSVGFESNASIDFQRDSHFDWSFTLENELAETWSYSTDIASIELTLRIKEKVTIFGHLGWDFGGFLGLELQWFETWLGVDTSLTISLEGTASAGIAKDFDKTFDFVLAVFYFFIGPVPFEANLNFEVKPSVDVGVFAAVNFIATLSFAADFKAGLRYDDGWSPIFEKSLSCDKSWSFDSRISAWLRPSVEFRLALYFYNTAGPFVGFNPWAKGEIEYHPEDDVANWTLSAGYAIYAGFTCKGELSALLGIDSHQFDLLPRPASTIKQWPGHWGIANTDVSIGFPRDEIPLGSGAFISGEVASAYPGNFRGFLEVKYSNNSGLDWHNVPSGAFYCTNEGEYHVWWVPSEVGDYLIQTSYYGNSEYKANQSIVKPLKVSLVCSGPADYGESDGHIDTIWAYDDTDPYTTHFIAYRFKAPAVSWTLEKLRFFGNFTGYGFRHFMVEIWDSNFNTLYSTIFELQTWYVPDAPMNVTIMPIGPIAVSGDYYVCIDTCNDTGARFFVGMDVLPAQPNQTVYGNTYIMQSTWIGPMQYERTIDSHVANMDLILYATGESILTDHGAYGEKESTLTLRSNQVMYTDDDYVWIYEQFNSTRWNFAGSQIQATWRDPDGNVFHTDEFTTPSGWNGEFWANVSVADHSALFYDYIGRPFEVEINITYTRTWNDDNGTHVITNLAHVITENFVLTKHPTEIEVSVSPNVTILGIDPVNIASDILATTSGYPSGTMTLKCSNDNMTWSDIASGPLIPVAPGLGRFAADWTPPHAGEYFIQSVWSQDAHNGNAQGMNGSESMIARLTVDKAGTTMNFLTETNEILAGSNLTIVTELNSFKELPLENKTIVFQISFDMSTWYTIGANNTNSTGRVECNWTVPDVVFSGQRFDNGTDPIIIGEGTTVSGFNVRTLWLGDDDYLNDTTDYMDVTVIPSPPVPVVDAEVTFSRQTIDASVNGTTVAAYIEIPEGNGITPLNASGIDVHTIGINSTVPILINGSILFDYAEPEYDASENRLKVYFNGTTVLELIINTTGPDAGEVTFNITGKLIDGAPFAGTTTLTYDLTSPVLSYLTVRGLDNRIYYRSYNCSGSWWNAWNTLPGMTCDSPTAAIVNNQLHIVVRGMDESSLWHGYLSDPADPGTFSGWALLEGATSSAPTLTSNGTTLCLVVRGLDDRIYYRCYSDSWDIWHAVPTGATCDGPAAAMLGDDLHIIVRGMDGNSLWHTTISCDGSGSHVWTQLSGATPSKPVLTGSQSSAKLHLAVRGMDDRIWHSDYSCSWESWNAFPAGATSDGPGATVVGCKLNFVVLGMDGNSLWYNYVDLITDDYSNWNWLSGATYSAPALAGWT